MKASVEATDALHASVKVELPWNMLSKEFDLAYKELAKSANIKGFRKGKVPRNVLRQRFGKQVEEDVLSRVIAESYEEALVIHRVKAVAKPELQRGRFEEGRPFQYTARVEIQPRIELKEIHIPVEQAEPEVKPETLDEALNSLREEHAMLTPIEDRQLAQHGDTAVVDYQLSLEGKPMEGGEQKGHVVQLGSGKSVPGFEEQVVGMQTGATKEFNLTFPRDWSASNLAGKEVHFTVSLNALKNREIPELNDEFVKDLGKDGCETVDDLKRWMSGELLDQEKRRLRQEAKEKLIDGLIQANPFPVPPSMVDRQQEAMAQEVELYLSRQGMTPEQAGLSHRKVKSDMRDRAEREIRTALLLAAVAEREKIKISEQELESAIENLAKRTGQNLAKIRALYDNPDGRNRLQHNILQDKVLDYLLEVAHIGINKGRDGADSPSDHPDNQGDQEQEVDGDES